MTWLLPILTWILHALPISQILSALITLLRELAGKTDTPFDDDAVNFLEMVFISLGLISGTVTNVQAPAGVAVVPTASKSAVK